MQQYWHKVVQIPHDSPIRLYPVLVITSLILLYSEEYLNQVKWAKEYFLRSKTDAHKSFLNDGGTMS